ncbi:MAG: helix-turn-helix transcriptional regulator, partial [Clostridia bacterium]|nr:helix-turn-helix transcriptional regulator [Clostridia bacterium]
RIRILYVLFEKEVCVCDIAGILDMTVSAVSHQLRVLRAAHLVRFRREGKTSLYSLADDHVKTIIDQGMEHISEG